MSKHLIFIALIFPAALTFAQEVRDEEMERSRALIEQGRELRAVADAEYLAAEPDCYERFLVNRCLGKARDRRIEKIREARALEIEGRRIELAEKQRVAAEQNLPDRYVGPDRPVATPSEAAPEVSNEPAERIRAQREAEAERAEAQARIERQRRDAEQAESRRKAEAAAAERAARAERDRERYDERIRRREAGD